MHPYQFPNALAEAQRAITEAKEAHKKAGEALNRAFPLGATIKAYITHCQIRTGEKETLTVCGGSGPRMEQWSHVHVVNSSGVHHTLDAMQPGHEIELVKDS